MDFDNAELEEKGDIIKSFHFEERLFDRDTLFVHQYKINFLYVLKAYSQFGTKSIDDFRVVTKNIFRNNFIDYFSNYNRSNFEFYEYKKSDFKGFVELNFRKINGKCFKTIENKLILAKHRNDMSVVDLICNNFKKYNIKKT